MGSKEDDSTRCDLSRTHSYSDLETTFLEAGIHARCQVREGLSVSAGHRCFDFEDDAPHLYDTSGSAEFYSLGVGWTF